MIGLCRVVGGVWRLGIRWWFDTEHGCRAFLLGFCARAWRYGCTAQHSMCEWGESKANMRIGSWVSKEQVLPVEFC